MRTPLLVLLALVRIACAAVDNPVCDKTGPNTYKIAFELSGKNEQVAIYASSRADRIDSAKPLARATASPVQVMADQPGRVYFHLKPRSGPTRVVAVRRIDLEGTFNTRDIGGYKTDDGHYVRWGMIYRSDQLHDLTDRDIRYLTGLGLKLVCDFRVDPERADSPTDTAKLPQTRFANMNIDSYGGRYGAARAASGAAGRGASGPGRAPAAAAAAASGAVGASGRGPQPYNWLPLAVPQYSRVFLSIAAGDVPILFHCFAGKDRTGVMAALLLSLLGVPRDVILNDYLLTNEIPDSKLPVLGRGFTRRGDNGADLEAVRRNSMVTRGQMDATFAMLDKTYGSPTAYIQKELALTSEDITAIRSRLLEP
jgi:protein-tyrosine phosphatase